MHFTLPCVCVFRLKQASRLFVGWLLAFILAACTDRTTPDPQFADVYASLQESSFQVNELPSVNLYSFSVTELSLSDFIARVVDETGISIAAQQSLTSSNITIDIRNSPIDTILSVVARSLGAQMVKVSDIYYLGELRPEDRAVYVRRTRRLARSGLEESVRTLLSETGRSSVSDDGLVIVADRVEVIQRVTELLSQIESAPTSCWVIQYFIFQLGTDAQVALGFNLTQSIELSSVFANGSSSSQALGAFKLLSKLVANGSDSRILSQPLVILSDGQSSKWHSGTRYPVIKKTESQYGNVVTTGYDVIETGLSLSTALRETSPDAARLDVAVTLSSLAGRIEDIPITKADELSTVANISSGRVYLVGSLNTVQDGSSMDLLTYGRQKSSGVVQVWCRANRISYTVVSSPAPSATGALQLSSPSR